MDEVECWLRRSAEHFIEKLDAVEEYADVVEGSYQRNRPAYCREALHVTFRSGDQDLLQEAIEPTFAIDHEWSREEYPEFRHALYSVLALAAGLDESETDARAWLEGLASLDHDVTTTAKASALGAILDGDERTLARSIERMLARSIERTLVVHRDEFGQSPEVAGGFVSIDAAVYAALAERDGVTLDREQIDDDLLQFLPESLPD